MATETKYVQPSNPTDEERHKMLKITLEEVNRTEDFENLLELLSPPPEITGIAAPGSFKGIKVGIIGGGLAGLSCAFELRKLGFDITIFEREESRIGGRIYTHYFDKDKKHYGELGAMRIPADHETTWHYINTFQLNTRPFIQTNENAIIYVRNKRARNDKDGRSVMENIYPEFELTEKEAITPWQQLIGNALAENLKKINPTIRKEILQVKKDYSEIIKNLGSLSIRKTLELMGLSEGAIELISSVAPFLGSFYYNSYYENLQEEYTVDYAFRYEIDGGAIKLPLAFYKSLCSKNPKEYSDIKKEELGNVKFKCGKVVTGIYKEKEKKVTLKYKKNLTSQTIKESFDFVICAIPFSCLRNIDINPMFSPEKMQAIKEVNYTSAQKTAFFCNKKFWEKGNDDERIIGGGTSTDLSIETIWYNGHYNNSTKQKNKKNSYDEPGVLLASYNLNQDAIRISGLNDKERIEVIKRQIEIIHGLKNGFLDSVVEDYKTVNWNNEEGSLGGFCYYMPEQQNLFAYAMEKSEYNNRIFFAGEHISLTHGWIEGAVSTGMKSANNIVKQVVSG